MRENEDEDEEYEETMTMTRNIKIGFLSRIWRIPSTRAPFAIIIFAIRRIVLLVVEGSV